MKWSVLWAAVAGLDEIVRADGEVVSSSRPQIIQNLEGGILESLEVAEGDRVAQGAVVARLHATRYRTEVDDLSEQITALEIRRLRLEAELAGCNEVLASREAELAARDDEIAALRAEIAEVEKRREVQRGKRDRVPVPTGALVGYTNAGKSTLLNKLTGAEVYVADKLFATLDPTMRQMQVPTIGQVILADTVGFIRKLPHQLVESFKSTLDEVRESDLLLHVVDISNLNFENQIEVVNQTLAEIGASDKPIILLFNKTDAFTFVEKEEDDLTPKTKENFSLEDLQKTWIAKMEENTIFISALKKTNFEQLRKLLYEKVKVLHIKRYPYNNFLY